MSQTAFRRVILESRQLS